MTNLPAGWTISEPQDPHDPHTIRRDGVPVAAVRIRATAHYTNGQIMSGQWRWVGLEGAGALESWSEEGFHEFDEACAAAVKRLTTPL